jgi:hypothetical protein
MKKLMILAALAAAAPFTTPALAGGIAPPITVESVTPPAAATCIRWFVRTTNCAPLFAPPGEGTWMRGDDDPATPSTPVTPPVNDDDDEADEDEDDGPRQGCNGRKCAPDSGGGNSEGNEQSDQDDD